MQRRGLLGIGNMMTQPVMAPRGSIVPPRVGRVLLAVCWLVLIYGNYVAVSFHAGGRSIGAWVATAVFLVTFTVAIERQDALYLLPVSALASVVMQFCAPSNGAFVAVIAVTAVAGIRMDSGTSRPLAIISGVAFVAAGLVSSPPLPRAQAASIVPGLLFTYLSASATRRLRIEQYRTARLLEEVVAGRDAVIRVAALDERSHLAREMHDVLAHTLSALSIQLEGARLLAKQSRCDPAVVAALDRTSGLAKQGLREAQRAVGSLREGELPGPDLLPRLVHEFERDTGVQCRLQIEGDPIDLSAGARLALYRVAQEALTNARKHAKVDRANITLRYSPDAVELTVEDWGVPRAASLPSGGYGVTGMQERAECLGGRLDAGPTVDGYRVSLWIPVRTALSAS